MFFCYCFVFLSHTSVRITVRKGHPGYTLLPTIHNIGSALIIVGQGQGVVVQSWETIGISFQGGPLIVGKGHGEESLRVAHKLVHVPLTGNLGDQRRANKHSCQARPKHLVVISNLLTCP